jgi:transcriptional regulator
VPELGKEVPADVVKQLQLVDLHAGGAERSTRRVTAGVSPEFFFFMRVPSVFTLDLLGEGVRPCTPRSEEEEYLVAKQKPELPQGTLDLLVLKALSLGPMHGYGVGQRIEQLAEDMLRIEEGTLYPALYRIEQKGWIESEWGVSENKRRARFYKLTRQGRRQLAVEESQWEHLSTAVAKVLQAT